MKNVLCYGDSNTWGYNAETTDRFAADVRWTGVLKKIVGDDYYIIEEGLNGRTTLWDDPFMEKRNGRDYLAPCLETHRPLDLVIIMLGTNDLKSIFGYSAYDIAEGAGVLADIVLKSGSGYNGGTPKILLISPIQVGEGIKEAEFADMFNFEKSLTTSKEFAKQFKRVAEKYGCEFMDAAEFAQATPLDQIHLDADGHQKLGVAIAEKVKEILG
ncbi:SGNH/GDSL hydrolase family protein [Halalkalibacter nanhaiisediminis]|uniref:Lysophospholipase L1-like esterase n=1 Tax=Halalkalibacter nanhaiisediminis TaxID=688079 RepID=A0A562QUH8_9BACI|nr:SGNH/GDSL hydrolase family protein [Halalkalibacter nanhaiisediminis]TWI59900.1 lysophospholipase L1-like esterase [Halalkalibacter nanhaiisediminis]